MTDHQNGPVQRERAPEGPNSRNGRDTTPTSPDITVIASRQVSWWSVHEKVSPLLAQVGSWPMAGSPEWCELADADPVKLAALYDAAQHWALRLEMCQTALAEASRDISAATDWSAVARKIRQHREVYIPRERVAS